LSLFHDVVSLGISNAFDRNLYGLNVY
jgi:hypothetical protein